MIHTGTLSHVSPGSPLRQPVLSRVFVSQVGDRAGDVSVRGAGLCRAEESQDGSRADHRLSEGRPGQPEGRTVLPQEKPRGGSLLITSCYTS